MPMMRRPGNGDEPCFFDGCPSDCRLVAIVVATNGPKKGTRHFANFAFFRRAVMVRNFVGTVRFRRFNAPFAPVLREPARHSAVDLRVLFRDYELILYDLNRSKRFPPNVRASPPEPAEDHREAKHMSARIRRVLSASSSVQLMKYRRCRALQG